MRKGKLYLMGSQPLQKPRYVSMTQLMEQLQHKKAWWFTQESKTKYFSTNSNISACEIKSEFKSKVSLLDSRITDIQVYDPAQILDDIQRFQFFFKMDFPEMELIPEVQKEEKQEVKEFNEKSSLLQSLQKACKNIEYDWENYINTKSNGLLDDLMNETNRKNYLVKIVELQAFDLFTIIHGLVDIEGYEENQFEGYSKLETEFEKETDLEKRAKILRKAMLVGMSVIPAQFEIYHSRHITPVIGMSIKSSNG